MNNVELMTSATSPTAKAGRVQLIVVEHGGACPIRGVADASKGDLVLVAQLGDESEREFLRRVASRVVALSAKGEDVVSTQYYCSERRSAELFNWRVQLSRVLVHAIGQNGSGLTIGGALLDSNQGQMDVWAIVDALLPMTGNTINIQVKFPVPSPMAPALPVKELDSQVRLKPSIAVSAFGSAGLVI
jgi:hypothetical protein